MPLVKLNIQLSVRFVELILLLHGNMQKHVPQDGDLIHTN